MRASYDIDYDVIARHVRDRLANAKIIDEPFPHLQIERVLPEDYYDILLDALPIPQDIGSDNSAALNFHMHPEDSYFSRMTPSRKQLWLEFEEHVNRLVLRPALTSLFSKYLPQKFDMVLDKKWRTRAEALLGKDWQQIFNSEDVFDRIKPGSSPGGRLLLVTRGFNLAPHIDDPDSLLTYLLYLPRDNTREHLGTRMHNLKDKKVTRDRYREHKSMSVWFVPEEDISETNFIFPFRRNSLLVMLCVPTAVHSVNFEDVNCCRYLIQTQIVLREDVIHALFKGWRPRTGVSYENHKNNRRWPTRMWNWLRHSS